MSSQNIELSIALAEMRAEVKGDLALIRQDNTYLRKTVDSIQYELSAYKEESEKKYAKASSFTALFRFSWIIATATINLLIVAFWESIKK